MSHSDPYTTIESLKSLVYTFFPKGMSDAHADYKNTPENINLIKISSSRRDLYEILVYIGQDVIKESPLCEFDNLSDILKHDRCVKAKFILRGQKGNVSIVLYISYCAPLYVLHQTNDDFKFNTYEDFVNNKHIFHLIDEKYSAIVANIENSLSIYLPTYTRLDESLINVELDDIEFDGIGRLNTSLAKSKKMTIFNAFFSTKYF